MKIKLSKSQWKLIGKTAGWTRQASDWSFVQENNQKINNYKRMINEFIGLLRDIQEADPSDIETLTAADKILSESYLDSGWSYDKDDTRNLYPEQRELDNDESGKFGTSKEEEMRAQIQQEIAIRRAEDVIKKVCREYPELAEEYEKIRVAQYEDALGIDMMQD